MEGIGTLAFVECERGDHEKGCNKRCKYVKGTEGGKWDSGAELWDKIRGEGKEDRKVFGGVNLNISTHLVRKDTKIWGGGAGERLYTWSFN